MSEDKGIRFWALKSPVKGLFYDLVYFSDAKAGLVAGPIPREGGAVSVVANFNCGDFEKAKEEGQRVITEHEKK
jgi:hypothetical protein